MLKTKKNVQSLSLSHSATDSTKIDWEKKLNSLPDNNINCTKIRSNDGSSCNVITRKQNESNYVTSSFSRHPNNNRTNYIKLNHTLNFERNHRKVVDTANYVAKHQRISDTLRKKTEPYPRVCLENPSSVETLKRKSKF